MEMILCPTGYVVGRLPQDLGLKIQVNIVIVNRPDIYLLHLSLKRLERCKTVYQSIQLNS